MVDLPTYHENQPNVGKYTSPMDGMGSELLSHLFGKSWDAPAEWPAKRPKIEAYNNGRYCTVVTKIDDPPTKRVYMYSPYFPPLNMKFKNQSTQKHEEAVVWGWLFLSESI